MSKSKSQNLDTLYEGLQYIIPQSTVHKVRIRTIDLRKFTWLHSFDYPRYLTSFNYFLYEIFHEQLLSQY